MRVLVPSSLVALLASAAPALAAPDAAPTAEAVASSPEPAQLPRFGVLADAGLPDGMNAAVAVRPWKWLRVQGGVGTNTMSTGFRGGLTVLPFGWGPSASVEVGRYLPGNANAMAQRFVGDGFENQSFLQKVGYDYVNGHLGLDFGSRNFVFFIHGGVTRVSATFSDGGAAPKEKAQASNDGSSSSDVTISGDSKLRLIGPSLKVGLVLFVL